MVLQRLPVDTPDLSALAHPLVTALAAFLAQPAALDHLCKKRLQHEALAPGVVRRQIVQVLRHQRPHIQSDDVEQAVTGAFRQPDRRSGERVHFLDGVVILDSDLVCFRRVALGSRAVALGSRPLPPGAGVEQVGDPSEHIGVADVQLQLVRPLLGGAVQGLHDHLEDPVLQGAAAPRRP